MFLGYQGDKIRSYTEAPPTGPFYVFDRIEETQDEYILVGDEYLRTDDSKAVADAKNKKIKENDIARDIALNEGVTYRDVLFDSDIDQKINLLAKITIMSDEDTITWYGMDNQALECTKGDLIAIGNKISDLHTFCWTRNAELKETIGRARTVNGVNKIKIDYEYEE